MALSTHRGQWWPSLKNDTAGPSQAPVEYLSEVEADRDGGGGEGLQGQPLIEQTCTEHIQWDGHCVAGTVWQALRDSTQ